MLSLYGVEHGMRHARKHLGWYLDRFAPGLPAADRTEILTSTAPESVHDALWRAFHWADERAEAA
jgi:tRNA-dihydrouridine synthase